MDPQATSLSSSFQYHAAVVSGEEEVRKSIQKERVSIQVDEGSSTSSSGRVSLNASPATRAVIAYDLHTVSIEELETRFNTKKDVGLTGIDAENKLRIDGPNVFTNKSYKWILDIIGYYFGGICLMLWPAVILCILAYQPFGVPNPDPTNLGLAVVIFFVILIQGSFGLLQDYSSSKVMKSINSMLPQDAIAIRDGKEVPVPIASLVTGDIVKIENGNRVPADLRLFTVQNLKLDTSMLTGESEPITCTTQSTDDVYTSSRNLAFMGCGVCEGVGYGMVVGTGNNTVMGKVAKLASGTNKGTSTLRKETLRMVFLTAVIAIITGVILVIYWAAYLRVRYPTFMTVS
jgi:sodium/potassium-transporting ATPase subunit alpha